MRQSSSRIHVHTLRILEGEVLVDLAVQGPADALCCPTFEITKRYRLTGARLVDQPAR